MRTTTRKRGSPLFLMLFSLPFLGVGVAMGVLALRTLNHARFMEHWPEIPATILESDLKEHHGDDSTTYRVTARYTYVVDGHTYESTRVGLSSGSDNIGSWHEDRYRELQRAMDGERVQTCRVNPANPEDAILFPQVRYGMLAFHGIFVVAFGGGGLAMLVGGIRMRRRAKDLAEAPEAAPWSRRAEWASGRITSGSRAEATVLALMAVIWNGVAWPIALINGDKILADGGAAWLVFLFPVIGLFIAAAAVRARLVARRYGAAYFQMAPVPGVLGGRLAGLVHLPEAARPPDGFVVSVQCVQRVRRGKNSYQETLWKDERVLDAEKLPVSDQGQALPVLFALPYDQPPSDEEPGGAISWRLIVQGSQPGVDVALTFEIPVFMTADSRPDFVLDEKPIAAFLKD